ncbi:MAG: Asp-tRNA(Asn)/Glu-tRNA(Gln) amidotransferase subunit GatC [Actinobacteria bacterium]|nr:MAG: Asp-tRNA(Asn)/Glu-tRNA(Gln) amidotransferase subunit GatC [Actinomycetota bacterium]
MKLSREEVMHVARLARLAMTDEEVDRFGAQLSAILDHAARVSEVAADDVPPTSHALPLSNVFREDVVGECLSQEKALSTAPETEDGRFKVPRIIEEA